MESVEEETFHLLESHSDSDRGLSLPSDGTGYQIYFFKIVVIFLVRKNN